MTIDTQPGLVAPIKLEQDFADGAEDTVPTYVVSMDRLAQSDIDPKDLEAAVAVFDEVMQQPEETREELWEFYLQEILPLYRVAPEAEEATQDETPEAKKAREEKEAQQARNRHLGNVAWWAHQQDDRYFTLADRSDHIDAIDARYELRKALAFANGATKESWNEAFQPWDR